MQFLCEETFHPDAAKERDHIDDSMGSESDASATMAGKEEQAESLSFYEILHARYAPSRRLKHMFFDDLVLVSFVCQDTHYCIRGLICTDCPACRSDTRAHTLR